MADRGKRKKEKGGKTEIQIFVYLDNEKSLLDEIKIIFRNYLRAEKKKKKTRKIVDTRFKVCVCYIFASLF